MDRPPRACTRGSTAVADHCFIVTHEGGRLVLAGTHRGWFTRSLCNGSPPRHGGRVPQAQQSLPPPWPVRSLRPLVQACESSSFHGLISVSPGGAAQNELPTRGRTCPLAVYRFPVGSGMGLTGIVKVYLDTPPGRGSAALCRLLLPGILRTVERAEENWHGQRNDYPGSRAALGPP